MIDIDYITGDKQKVIMPSGKIINKKTDNKGRKIFLIKKDKEYWVNIDNTKSKWGTDKKLAKSFYNSIK
jgi:hypothetical protein